MVSFIDGGKREYTEKTTDLSQGTDKPYHLMIAQVVVNPTIIRSRSRRPLMLRPSPLFCRTSIMLMAMTTLASGRIHILCIKIKSSTRCSRLQRYSSSYAALARNIHLHVYIIFTNRGDCGPYNSLTTPPFNEVPVPSQESERSCKCIIVC